MPARDKIETTSRTIKSRRKSLELTTPPSNYTSTATLTVSSAECVPFDASGGAFTIYLPATPYKNLQFHFSENAGSATALTVDGNGKNINGAATLTMNGAYRQRVLRYNGTQWIIFNGIN